MVASSDFIAVADDTQRPAQSSPLRKRAHAPDAYVCRKRHKTSRPLLAVKLPEDRATFFSLALELRQEILCLAIQEAYDINRSRTHLESFCDLSDTAFEGWDSTTYFRCEVASLYEALTGKDYDKIPIEGVPALEYALEQLLKTLKAKLTIAAGQQVARRAEIDRVKTFGLGPLALAQQFKAITLAFIESERAAGRSSRDLEISKRVCRDIEEILKKT